MSGSRSDVGSKVDRVDRADQPTPVNLTSESSSVTVTGKPKDVKSSASNHGKTKVRKMQNSIGSVTSNDSGYGQGFERLDRQHSESPQLPPRRRYHQHYHRQHHHGKYIKLILKPPSLHATHKYLNLPSYQWHIIG